MSDAAELRRLAHRVVMPGFDGTSAPAWVRTAAAEGLGGVCLFGHNVQTPEQLRALTDELHAAGPLLVAVDEEGGIVSRLGAIGGSQHVGAAALGMAGDPDLTRQVAAAIGTDLAAAGIDLDLAPVVDVSSDPDNPVIGVRAFGTEPSVVAEHARAYVEGLREARILSCAKHFPGHGDTRVDSHVGLPRIDVDLETLRARDLVPFAAAVEAGVDVVMTAHIVFPALDERPATLSRTVLRLLREDLGFTGLITSDAMDMRAIVDSVGLAPGCVAALDAGVDLVGLGNPVLGTPEGDDETTFRSVVDAIVAAVGSGELAPERLREAAGRVDALAARGAARGTAEDAAAVRAPRSSPADEEAAARSLRVTPGVEAVRGSLRGSPSIVDVRRHRNVAGGRNAGLVGEELRRRLPGARLTRAFEATGVVGGQAAGEVSEGELPDRTDAILTGSPWLDERESAVLATLLARNPDAVVICTGWAPEVTALSPARNVVRTFGDSAPTARAVADLLVR
ncbi:glycoside hydrolase family 3 N-terminal domain-containing protein [Barrientosiimonas humi]|uniref:glycoside hydrolase family 3 N-terminal domain-containing protein n=1 Tax=Barrientosiimonas humi TaxID=999931 RepID=UPI00370D17EF